MKNQNQPDIFQWANQADAAKSDLDVELFVFSKNFTAYSLSAANELLPYVKALFLYDPINLVETGAATGMAVREIHNETDQENVIDFVELEQVPNAQAVIEQIGYSQEQLEIFNHDEHDITRMIGIVVKFTGKDMQPFYIAKQLQKSAMMSGSTAWALEENKVRMLPQQAALKVAADTQVLVIGSQIYAFNVSKFTRLFGYDAKREAVIDGKIADITKQFKLSFPDGVDMKRLTQLNATLATALLQSDPYSITQEQVIDQAEKFQLALMTDDAGQIIIMDGRDAMIFANLLNDDYVESDMTDRHYLATKKKEVLPTEDRQLNIGA